jgi:hypothetical protein
MYISTEIINPDRALKLLETQQQNRLPNKHHVAFLAEQMAQGLWMSNTGDTIKLNTKGNLVDGQHRLLAIVKAGMQIEVSIANGVTDEAVQVLDTGRSRTAVDAFTIAQLPNSNNLLSAIRFLMVYEQGKAGRAKERIPVREMIKWSNENASVLESYKAGTNFFCKSRLLPVSDYVVLHFLFTAVDAEICNDFLTKFTTGLNLKAGCPVYLYREKMQRHREGRYNFDREERLAMAILAWNWLRKAGNIPMSNLKYNPILDGFPTVK